MSIEPLNTTPIQQFIQQVKAAENGRKNEIRMDITQAKNLAFTLGIVMSRLNGDLEKLISEQNNTDNQVIQVKLDGGTGWN